MSRSELSRTLGSIAALLVSYAATFWLFTMLPRTLTPIGNLGWISAIVCVVGVGVFSWAKILASVANKRHLTERECRYLPLVTIIPGCILFWAGGFNWTTGDLVLYQFIFTGVLLRKFAFPDAD